MQLIGLIKGSADKTGIEAFKALKEFYSDLNEASLTSCIPQAEMAEGFLDSSHKPNYMV